MRKGDEWMSTIVSHLGQATEKATALQQATEKLQKNVATVTMDEETTVAGNTNAHEAIQAEIDAVTQIASALITASSNLQSVAHDFASKDAELGQCLQQVGGTAP